MKPRTVSGFVVSFVFHALLVLLLPGLQTVEWEASPPESLEVTYHSNWQQAESIPEQPEGPEEPEPEPAPDQPEEEPEDEPEPQEAEEQEPVEPEPEPEEPDEPQEAQEPEQPQEPEQEPEVEEPQPEPVEQPTETEPEGEPEPVEEPQPEPVEPERELIDPGELAAGEVDPAQTTEGQAMDRELMEREVRFAREDGDETPTQQQRRARAELLELIEEAAAEDGDLEQMMESGQPLTLKAVEPEEEPEDPSRQPVVFELPTPGEEIVEADQEAPASPSPQDRITDRRALHQPLPQMPTWLEEEGTSVRVLVEFEVNEEGEVQRQRLRSSSGYPELDDQVLSKVAEWQYEPGPSGDTRLVAFRFELRPGGGVEPGTES